MSPSRPASAAPPAPTHALPATPGDPLGLLVARLRAMDRVDGAVLYAVEGTNGTPRTAASWFSAPVLNSAVGPLLIRPSGPRLPALAVAALDRGSSLFLPSIEAWQAAPQMREQVADAVGPEHAEDAWAVFRRASVIACPVRTAFGSVIGVLVAGSADPERPLRRADLAMLETLSDLGALALEHAAMLATEVARSREDLLLKRATEATAASLELGEVEQSLVEHALTAVHADHASLSRPAAGRHLALVAAAGADPGPGALDPAELGAAARSRSPRTSTSGVPAAHVPVVLGRRLFGVLSVVRTEGPPFGDGELDLLVRVARVAAAGLANAIDFDRERRIARSLTRGFVPGGLPAIDGHDVAVLYEPADDQPVGGDVYGIWQLPGGRTALLVGDVAGKGVETAALSAMARFFIEARSWSSTSPAAVLAEADAMLSTRLPPDTFVTAFLALLGSGEMRFANAGHLPPLLVRATGTTQELSERGLPLGVAEGGDRTESAVRLERGDLVIGYTDGLVEARRGSKMFGAARLAAALTSHAGRGGDLGELLRALHGEARDWAGALTDDAVLLALRRSDGARANS